MQILPSPRFFAIPNLSDHQAYKDDRPVKWIKLHAELARSYRFHQLEDATKAHLVLLWLLASQHGNRLPWDPEWLQGQMGARERPDLRGLLLGGWIEPLEAEAPAPELREVTS